MELKDIAGKIDGISENVKASLDTATVKINENVDSKIKAATEASAEEIRQVKAKQDQQEETLNKIQAKANTQFGAAGAKSFGGELADKLTARQADLTNFKTAKKGFGAIELESKAVGNMTSAGSFTGTHFVTPTQVPGMVPALFEEVHMRDILPVGQTNSNLVRYVVDNGGEGGPTMVAEGATKPQMDRDLEIKDAPVRKIATYFRLPEEMVDDVPYITSFLSQIGVSEVMVVEDAQILYGDGTGQNLSGFNTLGTAFAAGTSVIGASANEFDVIGAAKKQLRMSKIGGNLIALVSPMNYYDLRYKRKDTTNNYIFQGGGNGIELGIQVDGVRILEHTAITAGDFFVFSPKAAQIFDRAGTTVRFYDQDQDNAIKNLITIVIEKRLALAIYRPAAIIKGTFSAAITDLTS